MAEKTKNYQLTKPLDSEYYDIQVFNGNMDVVDSALKNNADDIEELRKAMGSVATVFRTIPTEGWQEINYPTAGEGGSPYPFYIDVPCPEAAASSSPDVTLEPGALAVARNAGLCSVAEALDGSIRFWAQTIPSEAMEATVKLFESLSSGG